MKVRTFARLAVVALALPMIVGAGGPDDKGPKDKMQWCHFDADASAWKLIEVSARSQGHARHEEDGVPGGPVHGMDGHTHDLEDCSPVAPEPVERWWAVAYSNMDGIPGFDETTGDVMIAMLVDDGDGVPGAGETLRYGRAPASFDPAQDGWVECPGEVTVDVAVDGSLIVLGGDYRYFFSSYPAGDRISTPVLGGIDYHWGSGGVEYFIGCGVDVRGPISGVDDAYLDVDLDPSLG